MIDPIIEDYKKIVRRLETQLSHPDDLKKLEKAKENIAKLESSLFDGTLSMADIRWAKDGFK